MIYYIPYAKISIHDKIFGLALYNRNTKSKIVMDNSEIRENLIKNAISIENVYLLSNNNQIEFSDIIYKLPDYHKEDLKLEFIRDADLLSYANNEVSTYEPRKQYSNILDWIEKGNHNTLTLYGLRRTGKTVLLLQVARKEIQLGKKVSYIVFRKDDADINVLESLKSEVKRGVDILILDEITYIEDFAQWANILTDVIASNIKVIIAGTQSLSIFLAKNTTMFDRIDTIDTTYISFKEFSRIMGTDNIFDYMRYGGILSYTKRDIDIHKYIKSAIVDNIETSLINTSNEKHWPNIYNAILSNKLDGYVQLLVMNCSIQIALKALRSKYGFKDTNLRSVKQLLKNNITVLDKKINIIEQLEKIELNIPDISVIDTTINNNTLQELVGLLGKLDFIEFGDVKILDQDSLKNIMFKQPGVRYNQIIVLLDILIKELSEEYDLIKAKLTEDIEGRLLEEIIWLTILELYNNEFTVFQYNEFIESKEIDLVIQDKKSSNIILVEVKRSNNMIPEKQVRWLTDKQLNFNIEQQFGKIVDRYVLYTGSDTSIIYNNYNIKYRNISNFLLSSNRE